jgi:hypothetical protein
MKMPVKKAYKENLVFLLLAAASFTYIVLRAILIPAYHDEINTFFLYVQTGDFQPFYTAANTNNHVLNTLFAHLSFLVFGDNIFVLRLANVLSYLIYLFYIWKIAKTFTSRSLALAFFIAMISSLYVISFFSLARGYGMSMAFLIASVYYLIEYHLTLSIRTILLGLFAASLALWAYLGLMIPVLLLGFLFSGLFVRHLFQLRTYKQMFIVFPSIALLFLIPLYYAIKYSLFIQTNSTIYGSETHGFLNAVIYNLVDEFSGNTGSLAGYSTTVLLLITLVVTGIVSLVKNRLKTPGFLVQILLWGTIVGTIALNYWFNVSYPFSRMAVYFFILFMVPLFISIDEAHYKLAWFSGFVISTVFTVQLILTFNFAYAPCWRYDTLPKLIFNRISEEAKKMNQLPTISTNLILEREFTYFDFINNAVLNTPQTNDYTSKISDYIIANSLKHKNTFSDYDTIEYCEETRTLLLRRKQPYGWIEFADLKNSLIEGNDEYLVPIPDLKAEDLFGYPFCFDVEFKAESQRFPIRCNLIFDVWDNSNKSLSSTTIGLDNIHPDVSKPMYFHRRIYIEQIPQEAGVIKLFFTNYHRAKIKISDFRIRLYRGETKYPDIK